MKKALIVIGLFLVGVGFFLGRWSGTIQKSNGATLNSLSIAQISISPTAFPSLSPVLNSFLVTRVIDGDTIELENGERVRYIGIDTPETVDPRKPVQCFGVESSKRNKELVEDKQVWLAKDVTDKDRYGRLLRYVYLGDPQNPDTIFVNLELVREGFAHSYSYPPDIARQDEFVAAQRLAQEENRGLWGSCPIVPPSGEVTVTPTEVLGNTLSSDPSCAIKGNISSTGEKIYHLPGCGSYEKTQIDEGRGERWFCFEDEAANAGWRKAKNCP